MLLNAVPFTRGALVEHQYTHASPCSRAPQYRRTFIALSISLLNDLADPVFDGVGLAGFKSNANVFHRLKLLAPFLSLSLNSFCWLLLWGWGLRT